MCNGKVANTYFSNRAMGADSEVLTSQLFWSRNRMPWVLLLGFVVVGFPKVLFFQDQSQHRKQICDDIHGDECFIISPKHSKNKEAPLRANLTLRHLLSDREGFHLAMAPAFFGAFGYFGALSAWDEEIAVLSDEVNMPSACNDNSMKSSTDAPEICPNSSSFFWWQQHVKSVAGASAGAMTAISIAAGVTPQNAAKFCQLVTLDRIADFPGTLALFQGHKFERMMYHFLRNETTKLLSSTGATDNERNVNILNSVSKLSSSLRLEDSMIPVAVSAFDLQTMKGKLLYSGSMARAARASATFPFLFQPIGWQDGAEDYLFIDGGIKDHAGLNGLAAFSSLVPDKQNHNMRVVNMVIGDFKDGIAPGPSSMPIGVNASEVISISVQNLPQASPLQMSNGPVAVDAARRAMKASLDLNLFMGSEPGHYELHIDASPFWRA